MDQAPGFWSALLTLLLSAAVVMGSPGPSTASATAIGAAFGFRRSLPYVAGLMLGTGAVLAVVATGLAAILFSAPGLGPALTILSGLYMLWLAFRIATAPPLGERAAATAAPSLAGGVLLAIANPKAWLALGAVFASATFPFGSPLLDAAFKLAVLGAMNCAVHLLWLIAGAGLSKLLRDPVRSRIANLIFAILLVAATLAALPRL